MEDSALALIPILIILFIMALSLVMLALWIWMLIDCVSNEPSEGNDKIMWVLIILLLQGIGALLYYFIRRPQRIQTYGR